MLGPRASAGDPNRCVGVDSLAVGQCQEFAEKPLAPTESSEEPEIYSRLGWRGAAGQRTFGTHSELGDEAPSSLAHARRMAGRFFPRGDRAGFVSIMNLKVPGGD